MHSHVPTSQALTLLKRGVEAIYSEEELARKLASGRQLRIKLGMDPTAPDIHLGHTVVLRKMRQFQDLGHKAVLIIGDYTARIGDPTGRDITRPVLDEAAIQANATTYLQQAGLILRQDPEVFELHYNSTWLSKLTFADVLRLTGLVTVQQMLHRENFAKRMEAGREIMLSEFMYPIMQAYDSVHLKADVELGGTDQTFNNLMGRQLMDRHHIEKQVVIVMPILVGLDGSEKMSKSKGNYIGVTDDANNMYGKVMSIPDRLMDNYFRLLTPLPEDRIASLIDPQQVHPRQAKDTLARSIVEAFHNAQAANDASEEFRRRFAEGQLPTDMPTHNLPAGDLPVIQLILTVGFAPSNSEARRLVQQGGVSIDGQPVADPRSSITLTTGQEMILQVGKRRVCKIIGA
jgi:tyrosyl-tRNA synthetase